MKSLRLCGRSLDQTEILNGNFCAVPSRKGKSDFAYDFLGILKRKSLSLVGSVETFDQRVASLELFFRFLMNWGAVVI
jgi:hypothetical protein